MKKALKVSIFLIIGIFILGILGSLTSEKGKESFKKGMSKGEQITEEVSKETRKPEPTPLMNQTPSTNPITNSKLEEKVTYSIIAKAEKLDNGKIRISGTTNLPSKALFNIKAQRQVIMKGDINPREHLASQAIEKASVFDGKFTTDVTLLDQKLKNLISLAPEEYEKVSDEVVILITFDPTLTDPRQKEEVLKATGNNGEKLEGSPIMQTVGSSGEKSHNILEQETKIIIPYI